MPRSTPSVHQYRAWCRLSAKDGSPQNTIVTTGARIGQNRMLPHPRPVPLPTGQKGVKAIVLYPMNALAEDQEKRFVDTIWKNAQLKAAGIRVGNYTGRCDPADPQASMRGTVAAKAAYSLIIIKKMITILKLNLHASRNHDRILGETGEL